MPFLTYECDAPFPISQAAEAVRSFVSRPDSMGRPTAPTQFIGKVHDRGFRIVRVVSGLDSFNPVLYGPFHPSPGGTRIRVFMTFHPIVWLIILAWSSYFAYVVLTGFRANGSIDTGAFIMLLWIWAMALPFFYWDAARSRRLLEKCLHPSGIRFGG